MVGDQSDAVPEIITESVLKQLEQGEAPWRKPKKNAVLTSPLINTEPGAANQRSNCSVHARKSTPGGASIACSGIRRNGRAAQMGGATVMTGHGALYARSTVYFGAEMLAYRKNNRSKLFKGVSVIKSSSLAG
jgi:hypothetical protein